jgi:hypothetical protein
MSSELESVISLCRMVLSGKVEPFDVDFEYVFDVIGKNYPHIKDIRGFCLDAQALKEVSYVLESQNRWIAHQSTTLYKDPFMLNQQLMSMDIGSLAKVFLKSWHPIVELEQMSSKTLGGSLGYWGNLLPLSERWQELKIKPKDPMYATREDALKLGIIREERFGEIIEDFWRELGDKAGIGGSIKYWKWIAADTYGETVYRAYITSFMVSYGYANIDQKPLLEEITINHLEEPIPNPRKDKISDAILVDYEEWRQWRNE